MNLLNNDLLFVIIIIVLILLLVLAQRNVFNKRPGKTTGKPDDEFQAVAAAKIALETEKNDLKAEKEIIEAEKKKSEEKNRKTWQMSEAIYKEKAIVASENEILLKEKEKLESEKKKFEEKNKKLWNQSIAIFKEKDKIEVLKKDIEEKHHNVTESIRYAKRIQEAILPASELLRGLFSEYFVFYRPKDIVSGDFYWVESLAAENPETGKEDEIVLFAVVDCTGHGVPGAFMSIFGFNLLNQALDEHKLTRPSEILDFLSMGVLKKLRLHSDDATVQDSMDLIMCAFHRHSMKLEFAGVHCPLYHVRGDELVQYNTDKQSIGDTFEEGFTGYTNYEIDLLKGDIIYIFSDGFCDQFGGPQRRKYLSKNFKETIFGLRILPMDSQKERLSSILEEWKGDLEQIDDITVMGIKI